MFSSRCGALGLLPKSVTYAVTSDRNELMGSGLNAHYYEGVAG